jgi:hypothetical protein
MSNRKAYFLVIAISILLFFLYFNKSPDPEKSQTLKAVIVDGLVNFPNQTFVEETEIVLMESGFEVDIVNPPDVTVDFYEKLPSKEYDLIILRIHCGPLKSESIGGSHIPEGTVFFSTETYSPDKYVSLQDKGLLAIARITGDNENIYFAVPPWFFESVEEDFSNSTLILDSCFGFWYDAPLIMAETLRRKGIKMFIGWDGEVQVEHTDAAILTLIKELYKNNSTIADSVDLVMSKIGPDPYYKSRLIYYPFDSGDLVLKK